MCALNREQKASFPPGGLIYINFLSISCKKREVYRCHLGCYPLFGIVTPRPDENQITPLSDLNRWHSKSHGLRSGMKRNEINILGLMALAEQQLIERFAILMVGALPSQQLMTLRQKYPEAVPVLRYGERQSIVFQSHTTWISFSQIRLAPGVIIISRSYY